MPSITRFGERLTADLTTVDKAHSRTSPFSSHPAIQADRWARNGLHPDARLATAINEAANQTALYRTKQYFHMLGPMDSSGGTEVPSSTAGTRARWRFAFRTGPYAHALGAIVSMIEPNFGTDQNTYATLEIVDAATLASSTATFVYGVSPIDTLTASGGWQLCKQMMAVIDGLSPDTEYYGTFSDVNYGRLASGCAFELPTLSENGGYLATNITTNSAVLATHRQYPAEISNAVWQKGGSQVLTWSRYSGATAATTTSATSANIISNVFTGAATATSPGYVLDMAGKNRLGQPTGVPVTMKVYGQKSSSDGTVKLIDTSGAAVLTCTINSTTLGWFSVTGVIPATSAKYDLQFAVAGGTLSIWAVSIYEYG